MAGGVVEFEVAVEVAYDYLVAPRNRPEWQASLRAVELAASPGTLRPGLRWTDVTWPGLRPRMELTLADRPYAWAEHGRWRGFAADLTLHFAPTAQGCRVLAEFELRARGPLRPLGRALTTLAVRPVLADLRRAARILAAP